MSLGRWAGAAVCGLALAAAGVVLAQETSQKPPASPPPLAAPQTSTTSAPSTAPSPAVGTTAPAPPPLPIPAAPEPPAPKPVAAEPDEPKPPPEPLKRPRFTAAVMQGVDKITAETLRFEVKVGEPVRYKGLIVTIRACETTAADETITDAFAYAEVQSQPEVLPGRAAAAPRPVFHGWMFASSPTLHPLEHPVYDLWLIACKTASPGA
jgi:hypothetical protein